MRTHGFQQMWLAVALLGVAGTTGAQTYTKTETTTYKSDLGGWVLSQVERVEASGTIEGRAFPNQEVSRTEFTAAMQPSRTYSFGKLQQTLTYNADGTIATLANGRGNVTSLSGWKRGIPQNIGFADGTAMSARVEDNGTISWTTDELGQMTCYGYDAALRLNRITYPSKTTAGTCDGSEWYETTRTFSSVAAPEYGLPAGHWKQVAVTGNAQRITYFDALWRPVVEETYDAANVAGTRSVMVKRYDQASRLAFASYPMAGITAYTDALLGTRTSYDVLGRPLRAEQDSELGVLATTFGYLSDARGPYTAVTDPRRYVTNTWYQAFDEPSSRYPVAIAHPEGAYTDINRDIFFKPLEVARRNANSSLKVSRTYLYDGYQQLCRSQEPETYATLMGYDAAGNLTWSASGLPQGTGCDPTGTSAAVVPRKVSRSYDARDRLVSLSFPDNNGNQAWLYYLDGKPREATTYNDDGTTSVVNSYVYNNRGFITGETQKHDIYSWSVGYGYDPHGNRASMTYPGGLSVTISPNALGQATNVVGNGALYASGVSYYPNGGIRQFTYGNGYVHTMQQNARQLPSRVTSGVGVVDFEYGYLENGSVDHIYDQARGSQYHRSMQYDGLDRLTAASSPMFGGDSWHRFTYDVLDNIRSWKLTGVKDYADYYYDPSTQRLINIRNSAGSAVVGFDYDVQGNLSNKNGSPYKFDYGNRLRAALGTEKYRYDAQGRRVLTESSNGKSFALYGVEGPVLWERDERAGARLEYVYLGGSLLATRRSPIGSTTEAILYYHTDALGSPVAITDFAGTVLQRTDYDPYGTQLNRPINNRPAYTGHVSDAPTGLVYMQQRYYDPSVGRFLSVDPVAARQSGDNFNRYAYANNNPYKFTDPDGRESGMFQFGQYRMEQPSPEGIRGAAAALPVLGAIDAIATAIQAPTLANVAIAAVSTIPEAGGIAGAAFREARVAQLATRAGSNSVTIKSATGQIRVDLQGAAHHSKLTKVDVPTPHVQAYKNNVIPSGPRAGQVGSVTKAGEVRPATAGDLRTVDTVLKKRGL